MFSDEFTYGYPPRPYALTAYRQLLAEVAPGAPWMIAGLCCNILPLVPETIQAGGHIRVGLEDAPFGIGRSNCNLVEEAANLIRREGFELAHAADIRARLKARPG